jgi:hypothetical protein
MNSPNALAWRSQVTFCGTLGVPMAITKFDWMRDAGRLPNGGQAGVLKAVKEK